MPENFWLSQNDIEKEYKEKPKLYSELQEELKGKDPDLYEFIERLKELKIEIENNLNKEWNKKKLDQIKEIENNLKITEEILIHWTSKKISNLTFFHNYKVANMLVDFHNQDNLDLSWLIAADETEALILSTFKWKYLYLDWIKELSDEAFAELMNFKWTILSLTWLEKLTEKQYELLGNKKCKFVEFSKNIKTPE